MLASRASLTAAALSMAALALSACASPHERACAAGEPRASVDLYFGRSIKNAPDISEADFSTFLDQEVSPRFPQGLTVIDAQGRWRSEDGQLVREASKLVQIVLPGEPGDQAKLAAIREAYRRKFHQEAVLQVLSQTCAAF